MINLKYIFIFLLCISVANALFSQSHTNELWTELGASVDVYQDVSVDAVVEARFQEIGSYLKSVSGEVGFSYKVSKPFSIGVSYKCTEKYKPQGFFAAHTGAFSVSYREKFGDVRVAYRNKFEASRDMYVNESSDLLPSFEDRNRLKISYARKKAFLSPSISIETFHAVASSQSFTLIEMRYGAGLDFNLKNKYEAGIAYTFKQSFGKPTNTSVYSLSIAKSF